MNDNYEQQILGAMLTSRAALEDAMGLIKGGDFADYRHEQIFDAIVATESDGQSVNPTSVYDRLQRSGVRADLTYLHELVTTVVSAASTTYHCQRLVGDSLRRKVKAEGLRLQQLSDVDDPLTAVDEARASLDRALEQRQERGLSHEEAIYSALDSLDHPVGMKTPWTTVNQMIGGWSPGMLYVVGARPSTGKSVFGLNVILDGARRASAPPVFISLEMSKQDLYLRLLSNIGNVDGERILHRSTRPEDDESLSKAAAHLSRTPMRVDDRSEMSLAQIRSVVREQQRNSEVPLVVVDHIGIVDQMATASDRRVQVDRIAQGLKNLARDLHVPVVALAQLNRAIEGRANQIPLLSDLREAGGIEQAADFALLLHRTEEEPDEMLINVAKNRHGKKGHLHLRFRGEFSRIEDKPRPVYGLPEVGS